MKLSEIQPGGHYSVQGRKVKAVRVGEPYGPSGQPWGVVVEEINGEQRTLRAQDLDSSWTKDHERRWLARRRTG